MIVEDVPMPGDLLVTKRSATIAYEVRTVAGPSPLVVAHCGVATDCATRVAMHRAVNVRVSEDTTHFLCIARYRAPDARAARIHDHVGASGKGAT
jgi:hypothetical protein